MLAYTRRMDPSQGLSGTQVDVLRAKWGYNEIEEKKQNGLIKFIRSLLKPTSLMLVAASVLSFAIDRAFDGWFILSLLALNAGMTWWHERKADRALEELRHRLAVVVKTRRAGAWVSIPSRELVPGDIIECGVGTLLPADVVIRELVNLEVNDAVVTGESLPKEKRVGDTVYSGSVVSTGHLRGEVIATGNRTFFGKTAASGTAKRRSSMEIEILAISRYLIIASLSAAAILTIVFLFEHQPTADILLLDLSLFIAGIPVSLPTVMTLIISIGALAVARKDALVRRLTALEDFANTTLLLTDKTGTLTKNEISIERVHTYAGLDETRVLQLAYAATAADMAGAIDKAIADDARERLGAIEAETIDSIPGDSKRKRQTALVRLAGERYLVSIGTPPVLASLCNAGAEEQSAFDRDVTEAAHDGSRAVAVICKKDPRDVKDETDMTLAGLLVLSDPLRDDAKEALSFLRGEGVAAIMLTGDTKETAARVCAMLGLEGKVVHASETDIKDLQPKDLLGIAAFAEVMPDDKLALTTLAQKHYTVAVTGDGVNDLPAVRRADVGIAVQNAVDALKGTADIVFLAPGISAIETALVEARKIFFRLYNYSVYRISESFRLVVTVFLLGLFVGGFPMTPIQLILLAFLNDIPIITLAFDRVKRRERPAELNPRARFASGTSFGLVGVANSMLFYLLLAFVLHAPLEMLQTAFFLKLTVSGHMLIYVAHTKERWWRFLPSPSIIAATSATQALATMLALSGIFVSAIPWQLVVFVWIWAAFWMQVSELIKGPTARLFKAEARPSAA
jgi:H+-transporting ATPase